MRRVSQYGLASAASVSCIIDHRTTRERRYHIPCPGGIKLRCCSCRTWMFFCCETLVMALITTLAVLYIAHFTGKLAEGGAEVAQKREYAYLHYYHRRGLASQLGSSNGTSTRQNTSRQLHADSVAASGKHEPRLPSESEKWNHQVDYITSRFKEYVSNNKQISKLLQDVQLGKILDASAQFGAWSNVLYLRMTFELDNVTSVEPAAPRKKELRRQPSSSRGKASATYASKSTQRPRLLGPLEHVTDNRTNAKNETQNGGRNQQKKISQHKSSLSNGKT